MADIWSLINALPEHLSPDPERKWRIEHPGKVSKPALEVMIVLFLVRVVDHNSLIWAQISAGLLAGIATLAVVVRIYIHIHQRRKLFLDDYIVLFATACLFVETALVYRNLDLMYIEASLATNPMNIVLFTRGQVLELVNTFLKWTNIWQTFAWTTNYMIKISFLAFFRVLTRDVSRGLTWYWWFVLCFTIAAWIFNSIENIVICGASQSRKCKTLHA